MIDGLEPYPAYKDSGVAVARRVPEHWERRRRNALFSRGVKNGGHPRRAAAVASPSVEGRHVSEGLARGRPSDRMDSRLVRSATSSFGPGDLVNRMRAWQGAIGILRRSRESSARPTSCLRPTDQMSLATCSALSEFLNALRSTERCSTASRHRHASEPRLRATSGRSPILFRLRRASRHRPLPRPRGPAHPPLHRRQAEADRAAEEQKQAIIHRAVTRGLDPNVRLKPRASSGWGMCRSIGRSAPLKRHRVDWRAGATPAAATHALSTRGSGDYSVAESSTRST